MDGKRKLLVIGGRTRVQDTFKKCPETYDFEDNAWSDYASSFSCPNLYRAGLFFDENKQRIYIGGGQEETATHNLGSRMHYLDLVQQEWHYLPCANLRHNFQPILW